MSTPTTFDVATFGEAMMLLVADRPGPLEDAQSFHKRTAGAETNVAIGLARLGLKVGWASRLGADSMARYLLAADGGRTVGKMVGVGMSGPRDIMKMVSIHMTADLSRWLHDDDVLIRWLVNPAFGGSWASGVLVSISSELVAGGSEGQKAVVKRYYLLSHPKVTDAPTGGSKTQSPAR